MEKEICEKKTVPLQIRGAGNPSYNALRMNYIINRRWSRDLLVVSGVHGVEFSVS